MLVKSDNYGVINTDDMSTDGYYVIKFISEANRLQNNTTIGRNYITDGELVAKEQYLCSVQDSTNWYWYQKQAIIVPTLKVLHSILDVVGITYFQDISKSVFNRIQAKKGF